jgi:hypothetical protein
MGALLYHRFATAKTVLARRLGEKFRLADYNVDRWQGCESVQTQKPDDQLLIRR